MVRKLRSVAWLILAGVAVLAQGSGGEDGLEAGFFGHVMGYLAGTLSNPLPETAGAETRDACLRDGIPTELQVNTLGTTRSPFCPGKATATASSNTVDWRAKLDEDNTFREVSQATYEVLSGEVTRVRAEYTYNRIRYRWYAQAERYPIPEDDNPDCTTRHSLETRTGYTYDPSTIPDPILLFDRVSVVCFLPCQQGEAGCRCDSSGRCFSKVRWFNAYGGYVSPTITPVGREYP